MTTTPFTLEEANDAARRIAAAFPAVRCVSVTQPFGDGGWVDEGYIRYMDNDTRVTVRNAAELAAILAPS